MIETYGMQVLLVPCWCHLLTQYWCDRFGFVLLGKPFQASDAEEDEDDEQLCSICFEGWCSSGPHRITAMAIVMELPMRWHFCTDSCCDTWMQRRHDADAVAWLKLTTAERAKILGKE